MRLEILPLVLAVLIGLIGCALVFDACAPDEMLASSERRKRPRRERNRTGEAMVGLGVLAMAAAFGGRDTWRYSTLTVIGGAVLLLFGVLKNTGYLRDAIRRKSQ